MDSSQSNEKPGTASTAPAIFWQIGTSMRHIYVNIVKAHASEGCIVNYWLLRDILNKNVVNSISLPAEEIFSNVAIKTQLHIPTKTVSISYL